MAARTKRFDIALSVDPNNHYLNVITGPIIYDHSTKCLQIGAIEPYLVGDMNAIKQASAETIFELVTEKYINSYQQNSADITHSIHFEQVAKLQLFNSVNEGQWKQHRVEQQNAKYDVVIIANNQNQPLYTLHCVVINLLSRSISSESHQLYQTNDYHELNALAQKTKTIQINNDWKHSFNPNAPNAFKTAICYNFRSESKKNDFFEQSFDFGVITNTQKQIKWIICGVRYIYKANIIIFDSLLSYKNGYYDKLKECAQQIKICQPAHYRMSDEVGPYEFEQNGTAINKCLLFRIKDENLWIDFVYLSCSTYDVAVILDEDEKQIYFLNKVQVNWIDKVIQCAVSEAFMPKHLGLINKFGEECHDDSVAELNKFTLSNVDSCDETLKSIRFYRWNPEKQNVSVVSKRETTKGLKININAQNVKATDAEEKVTTLKRPVTPNQRQRNSVIRPSVKRKKTRSSIKEKQDKKSKKKNKNKSQQIVNKSEKGRTRSRASSKKKRKKSMGAKSRKVTMDKAKHSKLSNVQTGKSGKSEVECDKNKIWDLYVERYGNDPQDANKLINFSKKHQNIKSLTYKEVRQLFNRAR